ncbi:hypothetical protein WALSEDRAFT_69144 [Wallemia mellicola CBS 633.66]|uniref:Eukaryotic translation initiation factor 4E binding protein n=1 Tax=Wallemia mellicola (strain ATCC MYA-4683 / CBS 633.66) TaxID=671144 RepID=I4YBE0_WALMC|nr:hypothetical protein WALSEDRAFT_69144 [Wallemia mellicola CBS 633.66]EIM21282.1 hypothetical protein WALSEDRAFT_69144 [Wallemia mellicola CBS 633.66]|eukprot:XP_006958635.1 hypothetical protein WALSEDRAFT_69144 [Wallemia mellicola CBS 633.66]
MDIPKQASRLNLSKTPTGNNFYGSTPGGTKIVYSRDQLLSLASSPLSHTPPKGLSHFPAAMSRSEHKPVELAQPGKEATKTNEDTTFEMDD